MSRRKAWYLTLGTIVLVGVVAVATVGLVRGYRSSRTLPVIPTPPLSVSLNTKPDSPVWEFTQVPNGAKSAGVVAGTEKFALVGSILHGEAILQTVDAHTGELRRTTSLGQLSEAAEFPRCVTARTAEVAACEIAGTTLVVDLKRGEVVARTPGVAPIPAADGFWAMAAERSVGHDDVILSIGIDGKERWRATDRMSSGLPAGSAVVAIASTAGDDAKVEYRRDTDGRVEATSDRFASWTAFVGGFAVGSSSDETTTVYSLGPTTRSVKISGRWEPMDLPDLAVEGTTVTSVPLLGRSVRPPGPKPVVEVAGFDPVTGRTLWSKMIPGENPSSIEVSGAGAAVIIRGEHSEGEGYATRFADAYTGRFSAQTDRLDKPVLLVSDGRSILVSTGSPFSEGPGWGVTLLAIRPDLVSRPAPPMWTMVTDSFKTPNAYGGKVYAGLARLV